MDPEKMLKGRMAESLVEELLKKSKNQVYRFGYEAILQNLTQIEKCLERVGDTSDRIKALPDFIILDKNGTPTFLEVKFRWDGKVHKNDHHKLAKIEEFWNAKIIFVNSHRKPYFMISEPPYFDSEGNFTCKPLIEETEWKIDPKVYEEFETLVEKYLVPKLLKDSAQDLVK
ncbi:hypothetical protein BH11PAT2_BH11PAT2_09320 [soil metagenome]